MNETVYLIIALRLLIPLIILRWPLVGGVVAMLLDGADVILADILAPVLGTPGGMGPSYHALDKWLDLYYLTLEVIVSLRWRRNALIRNSSIILFVWRLAGMIVFELTGIRKVLFFAPNLFENFFLYIVATQRFAPRLVPKSIPQLLLVLGILYIPKFAQEWVLHYQQLQPWEWTKEKLSAII